MADSEDSPRISVKGTRYDDRYHKIVDRFNFSVYRRWNLFLRPSCSSLLFGDLVLPALSAVCVQGGMNNTVCMHIILRVRIRFLVCQRIRASCPSQKGLLNFLQT